jgi:hypothetical protein
MRMKEILNLALTDWEEEVTASAYVQGANAEELALHPMNRDRIAKALEGLQNLPKRVAAQLALEVLTVGGRRA